MSSTQDTTQCRALTADGERCSRPAGEDGYCFQHGPDDETVENAAAADGGEADAEMEEESDEESAQDGEADEEQEADDERDAESEEEQTSDEGDEQDAAADDGSDGRSGSSGDGGLDGVMEVRALAEDVTADVVGAPLDRIIEVERRDEDGGWLVVVEALERRAIPDTEDLLGRYAIQFDGNGTVEGYRLRYRYRRAEDLDDEYE